MITAVTIPQLFMSAFILLVRQPEKTQAYECMAEESL